MSEALSANLHGETAPSGQAVPARPTSAGGMAFHAWMAGTIVALLIFDIIGCRLTQIHVPGVSASIVAAILVVAIWQALPLYWHRKGRIALRDSTLTVMWAALMWIMLPFPADIAGRLGRAFPLRDIELAHLDRAMGVNIAAVAHWASLHWIAHAVNDTYVLLAPMLILAFLITGLGGKATAVKRLLVANMAAFAIGLPMFVLVPAVGPWYSEQFAPDRSQAVCQTDLQLQRDPGPYQHRPVGVICFPSFHVMWAILCAAALSSFRRLRWPAWILAALIVASTMLTGWHYFADVLGGFALAALSLAAARGLVRN